MEEPSSPQRKKRRQRVTIHEEDEESVEDVMFDDEESEEGDKAGVSLNALKERILGRPLQEEEDAEGCNEAKNSVQTPPASLEDLRRSLTCVICHEILFLPCGLPCGHSFCQGCLEWWCRHSPSSQHSQDRNSVVPCPTCRRSFLISNENQSDNEDDAIRFSYSVNTALRDSIQFLFHQDYQRRLQAAAEIAKRQTAGEDGGAHTRGYEILREPLLATRPTAAVPYPIARSIVLDANDQRMQLAWALYHDSHNTSQSSVIQYGTQDQNRNNRQDGNNPTCTRPFLSLTLALLHMEEDEVADSGDFPLVVEADSDQAHFIVSSTDTGHGINGLPIEVTLRTGVIGSTTTMVVPLARRDLGSDGTVTFGLEIPALETLTLHATDTDTQAKSNITIVFRHTATNVELQLQLPSPETASGTTLANMHSVRGSNDVINPTRSSGRRYLAHHDESDEFDQSEDDLEDDDGFIVGDAGEDENPADICQICLDGGDLIVCDGGNATPGCGMGFHLACIDRDVVPEGDWICEGCTEEFGIPNPSRRGHEFPPTNDKQSTGKGLDVTSDHSQVDDDNDDGADFSPLADVDPVSSRAVAPTGRQSSGEGMTNDSHSLCTSVNADESDSYTATLTDLVKQKAPLAEFDPGAAMFRFALVVAYDGEPFHGLAADPQEPNTVQAWLETKLSSMVGRRNKGGGGCSVTRHGRTDAGVHSAGTVLHTDFTMTEVQRLGQQQVTENASKVDIIHAAAIVLQRTLVRGLGSGHTKHIQVRAVYPVSMDRFHARRSSVGKVYRYLVHTGYPMPWVSRTCWNLHGRKLDVTAMRQVATHLLGVHDFSVFVRCKRRRVDYRSPIRHIAHISIQPQANGDDEMVAISIQADFFLTNMCRRIVGLLVQVGLGKLTPDEVADTLGTEFQHPPPALKNLYLVTAPPQGLCLDSVLYSSDGEGEDPTRPSRRHRHGAKRV